MKTNTTLFVFLMSLSMSFSNNVAATITGTYRYEHSSLSGGCNAGAKEQLLKTAQQEAIRTCQGHHGTVTNIGSMYKEGGAVNAKTCIIFGIYDCSTNNKPKSWYGCSNCKTNTDRESELNNKTGGFSRSVPALPENAAWNDLCTAMGKKCITVIDWKGTTQGCESWALDGSRAVLCEDL